jgi:hypothetical protein
MEHLFFHVSDERVRMEVSSARFSDVLERDWTALARNTEVLPHVAPTTEWLGFEHERGRDQEMLPVQHDLNMYPTIRGWDMQQAWDNGDLRQAHPSLQDEHLSPSAVGRRLASMLQSWLYFGLLEATIGKWVDVTYLVRPDESGVPLLYSRNLPFALYAWLGRLKDLPADERQADLDRAYDNLMKAGMCIQKLLLWSDQSSARSTWSKQNFPGYNELILMITPAIIRMTDVIGTTRDRIVADTDVRVIGFAGLPDARERRNARLIHRGWCRFLINYCQNSMNDSVLDWLDGTGRTSPSEGHDTCVSRECARNNIDTRTYKMSHCTPTCECEIIRPDLQDVLRTIDDNRIPTITLHSDQGGFRIEVSRTQPGLSERYVAFSHVWIDGLGSITEHGIYECQARRLAALAEQASGVGVPWWIDSLCVPDSKLHRQKSIRQLRNVYTNATKVLVIDKTISQCRSGSTAEDLLWAVVSSPWMQRLWTYQESFLATNIVVQFSDSLLELDLSTLPRSTLLATVQVVWTSLSFLIAGLRPDQSQQTGRKTNLGEVLTAVNWRSTSRRGDETHAVAALLDIDPMALTSTSLEDRMKAFLLMVRYMPHDIIFFNGPKLSSAPYRWAPATLMARSTTMVDTSQDQQRAECSVDGLCGLQCVLLLSDTQRGADDTTYHVFETSENTAYSIYWDPESQNVPAAFNAAIVRPIEDGRYLKPELEQVVEAVAVLKNLDTTDTGEFRSDYVGVVTIMKLDKDNLADGTSLTKAEWRVERLCIS